MTPPDLSQSGDSNDRAIELADLLGLPRSETRRLVTTGRVGVIATHMEARLASVRRYAQKRLDQATDPNDEDYQPGDENTADALLSARWILTLCDGKNA